MTVLNLPRPALQHNRSNAPVFADHMLFTEKVDGRYECPEHAAGAGILFMLSGCGYCCLNRQKEKLEPHSFLVINRGSRLSVQVSQEHSHPAMLFFHSGLVAGAMEDLSCLERIHSGQPGISGKLEWLVRMGGNCSSFSALLADGMIRSILEELILQNHAALRHSGYLAVAKRSTRVELYKRLSRTREWILDNSACPVTLDDMAKVAMLNSQHFLRMFSQCYGVTPHQFLIEARLGQARKMLAGSGERISVVCSQAGFESFSSFSSLFRKRFGVSPSRFRSLSH